MVCDSRFAAPNALNHPDEELLSSRRLGEGGRLGSESPVTDFVFSPNFKLLRFENQPPDFDSFREGFSFSSGGSTTGRVGGDNGVEGDSGVWIIGGSGGTGGGASPEATGCSNSDGEEVDKWGERSVPERFLSAVWDDAVFGRTASVDEGARRRVFRSLVPKCGVDGVVGVSCTAASSGAGGVSSIWGGDRGRGSGIGPSSGGNSCARPGGGPMSLFIGEHGAICSTSRWEGEASGTPVASGCRKPSSA